MAGVPPSGFPFGQTVTLVRRTPAGADAYGNDTFAEQRTAVPGCSVDPAVPAEDFQGTAQITAGYTVHMPPGTVVDGAYDQLDLGDGQLLSVTGIARHWRSPFTGLQGVTEVLARRVTGGGSAP